LEIGKQIVSDIRLSLSTYGPKARLLAI
jgi:hypothetical protein